MEPIRSSPYTVRRMELSLTTAEIYVRHFWWMLVGLPIGGILTLMLFPQPIMKYLGAVMILWPISIPARATLLTSDQRKLYGASTVTIYEDDAFYLDAEGGPKTRVPLSWARSITKRGPFYVINQAGSIMRGFGFILVKMSAFSDEDRARLERDLREKGKLR